MGAVTTYDLSEFTDNQTDDLRPGHWLTFSHAQLADLNNAVAAGTPQYQAQGNIYNSLLYHGDLRSEVSTLITGSGNDTIFGNDIDNVLKTNAGRRCHSSPAAAMTRSSAAPARTRSSSVRGTTWRATPCST